MKSCMNRCYFDGILSVVVVYVNIGNLDAKYWIGLAVLRIFGHHFVADRRRGIMQIAYFAERKVCSLSEGASLSEGDFFLLSEGRPC